MSDFESPANPGRFSTYRELGSVYELERQLRDDGICSRLSFSRESKAIGGQPFSRGALFHLLRNRVYLGEITHKDKTYPGLHEAIIDRDLFDEVQELLNANALRRRSSREKVAASPLVGLIFDADGHIMSPTAPLQQGRRSRWNDESLRRVSAPRIEGALTKALARLIPGCSDFPIDLIARVEVRTSEVVLLVPITLLADLRTRLSPSETAEHDPADRALCRIVLPLQFAVRGRHTAA